MDDLRELVRNPQTEIQRLMLEAVITIEVHARDVLYQLVKDKVTNINDFNWISQLRYYWVDDSDLKIRAVNAEFQYGYVNNYIYIGNFSYNKFTRKHINLMINISKFLPYICIIHYIIALIQLNV